MKTSELKDSALDWAVGIVFNPGPEWGAWNPSTDWAQGGPIIERERISVRYSDGQWLAEWWADNSGMTKNHRQGFAHNRFMVGPTPLIAAMRCYVASKLGDSVRT